METWQATIKEKGNEHLLKPVYMFDKYMFGFIKDDSNREEMIKSFLVHHWGLDDPDVEWYKLEKL